MVARLALIAAPLCAAQFTVPPSVERNPNPAVPLAGVVRFATGARSETRLSVTDGANSFEVRYPASRDPKEGLPVIGMRPGRRHEITIRTAGLTHKLEYTTPELPRNEGEFPPLRISVNETSRVEPGYTLFNPRRSLRGNPRFGADYGMLLLIDSSGEPVWYYRIDSRISDFEISRRGTILFVTQDYRIIEIDWLGNQKNIWYATGRPEGKTEGIPVDTLTFHHEIDELPNGNLVVLGSEIREVENYYTSEYDAAAPRKTQRVMGDDIVEFDRSTGKVVWRWRAFDYMDPMRIGYETFSGYWERRGFPGVIDWSHANNLIYDANDDSLIVNFRYQAAAVKIDRKTKQINWILGDPQGWGKLAGRLLKPEGKLRWPFHQHSPNPTPDGTVLIFDNGNYRTFPFTPPKPPRETYTRAVEYAIDEKARTIREVWSSEAPGKDAVVSFAMGDVEWLEKTKNVLVAYGMVMPRPAVASGEFDWTNALQFSSWTRLRQYTRNKPAEVVWELVMGDDTGKAKIGWALFGATHLPSLP